MLVLLTLWTIRGSLLLLSVILIGRLAGACWAAAPAARWAWTAGLIAAVVHVGLAMHVFHGWSHQAAVQDTARQLEARIGWPFGGGIYFNYAFLAVWSGDALWWWLRPDAYQRRSRWSSAATNGFLLLIAWNATVVFEDGMTRWAGHLVTVCLLAAAVMGRRGGIAKGSG